MGCVSTQASGRLGIGDWLGRDMFLVLAVFLGGMGFLRGWFGGGCFLVCSGRLGRYWLLGHGVRG